MCAYKRDVVVVIETSAYTYLSMGAYYPVFRSRAVDRKYVAFGNIFGSPLTRRVYMMDVRTLLPAYACIDQYAHGSFQIKLV